MTHAHEKNKERKKNKKNCVNETKLKWNEKKKKSEVWLPTLDTLVKHK